MPGNRNASCWVVSGMSNTVGKRSEALLVSNDHRSPSCLGATSTLWKVHPNYVADVHQLPRESSNISHDEAAKDCQSDSSRANSGEAGASVNGINRTPLRVSITRTGVSW